MTVYIILIKQLTQLTKNPQFSRAEFCAMCVGGLTLIHPGVW